MIRIKIKNLLKKIIPNFLLKFYHYSLAFSGAVLFGFPSRNLIVIGITGTKGKSTVVEMTAKILEEAGFNVASLSSIKFKIKEKEWQNKLKMTMPGRFKIQKFLRQAVKEKCKYAVLEVTSEGIKQFRHKFINFDIAVFTNLNPEHIEAHKGFENYRKAKLKLFEATKNIHIINIDDENAKYFLEVPAKKKYIFGIKNQELRIKNAEFIKAQDIELKENYFSFLIHNSLFKIHLLGEFNVYNALAAICAGMSQGVSLDVCKKALEKIDKVPGRMEIVISQPFTVVVDYAHTPDSLEKVYQTLKISNFKFQILKQFQIPNEQKPKLICVLGSCGGGRDKWKRPVLGKIAAKYCDEIIITNEDPYDEPPMKIIEEVASGVENIRINQSNPHKSVYKILDRREAIKKALSLAKPSDTVIITGKGSEPWMCLAGGKKMPWDEKEIVKEEYSKRRI